VWGVEFLVTPELNLPAGVDPAERDWLQIDVIPHDERPIEAVE